MTLQDKITALEETNSILNQQIEQKKIQEHLINNGMFRMELLTILERGNQNLKELAKQVNQIALQFQVWNQFQIKDIESKPESTPVNKEKLKKIQPNTDIAKQDEEIIKEIDA